LPDALTVYAQLEAWGITHFIGTFPAQGGKIRAGQYEPFENSIMMNIGQGSGMGQCDPEDPQSIRGQEAGHRTYLHEAVHAAQDVIDGVNNVTLESVLEDPTAAGMDYWEEFYPASGNANHDLMEQEGSSVSAADDGAAAMDIVNEAFANANTAIVSYGTLNWAKMRAALKL
jgi:hypothetical protein